MRQAINENPVVQAVLVGILVCDVPEATVRYGFRGPDSVLQAVKDALYKGPDDPPYYPD